jgi:hypothetical protein
MEDVDVDADDTGGTVDYRNYCSISVIDTVQYRVVDIGVVAGPQWAPAACACLVLRRRHDKPTRD